MFIRSKRSQCFAAAALLIMISAVPETHANNSGGVTVQNAGDSRPELFFACDGDTREVVPLFKPDLVSDLHSIGAGVALSTEDFSEERAALVRRLNTAGVPVIAWLVLPGDQGYYANAGNAPQTLARFYEFDRWTHENNLRWEAVGLDIEPNLSEFAALRDHKLRLAGLALHRAFDSGSVQRARDAYTSVIHEMQSRGYSVQTYQFPFIADERKAHATFLERMLQLVDVQGNDEALMVYTSFHHSIGPALIWEYGPDAQMIAVGSTASSGDASIDAMFPPLNWDEFSRDVIVARHFSPTVGVYNLQGAVQQGFIAKLKTVNWAEPLVLTPQSISAAIRVRRLVRAGLWLGSNAVYVLVAFVVLFAWAIYLFVQRRQKRRTMIAA